MRAQYVAPRHEKEQDIRTMGGNKPSPALQPLQQVKEPEANLQQTFSVQPSRLTILSVADDERESRGFSAQRVKVRR